MKIRGVVWSRQLLTYAASVSLMIGAVALSGCGGGGASGTGGSAASSGESATPKQGGTLQVALRAEAETLDPAMSLDGASSQVIAQIIEPLLKMNAKGQLKPWLAESVTEGPDHLTWTVELRPDVTFSDGKKLTSADVVYSLDRLRKTAAHVAEFEPVTDVTAAGPDAVKIRTKTPMPALPSILGNVTSGIVPNNLDGMPEQHFAEHPIGTGPFTLATWTHGQTMTLRRNPHYWQSGEPHLDELVFSAAADPSSGVQELLSGELNVLERAPFSQIASLKSNPDLELTESERLNYVDSLVLNTHKLFKDRRLREAVNLAVDRAGIVSAALGGLGEPAGTWISPAITYSDQSIKPPARNVQKAKALVAQAAGGGAAPALTLLYFTGEDYSQAAAQILQQNLSEVGFNAHLRPLEEATAIEDLVSGEFDAALVPYVANTLDPAFSVSFYTSYNAFFSGGPTDEISELEKKAATSVDPAERRDLYYQIQEKISDDLDLLPLDYEPFVWVASDNVVGLSANPINEAAFSGAGFAQ